MDWSLRLSALWGRMVRSLWFWPAVSIVLAIVLAELLVQVQPSDGVGNLARFGGTPEGARAILSTVAGSTITVTGLTFSLTVVALQVASSQFTPRLLSSFLADRGNQAVLSVFLGTFAYTLTVLRSVRSPTDNDPGYVPDLAVGVGLLVTGASVGMLVYFFHHITQQLRLETVLHELRRDTLAAVKRTREDDIDPEDAEVPDVPASRVVLRARRSGYLQAVRLRTIASVAQRHGAAVRLAHAVGVHVTAGTTLGWAWAVGDDGIDPDDEEAVEALSRELHGAIHLGVDRSLDEDVAYGIRQLVDIAARALSPGVNDPTSAVAAIDAMAEVCSELAAGPPPAAVRRDDEGRVRAAVSPSSFGELLALACDQPRRYGRGEPALLAALLRMLTDVAETARGDDRIDTIRTQIEVTLEAAADADLSATERERVERVARQAHAACDQRERVARLEPEDDEEQPAT